MATKSKTKKSVAKKKSKKQKHDPIENHYIFKFDILVVGIGTIGEPLTRLLLDHKEEFGIGDVYFAKFTPTDIGSVKLLTDHGGKFAVWSNTLPHFEHILPQHGLEVHDTIENVLKKVYIVIDCTNRGNQLKEEYYSKARYPIGFIAQGSEEGFGHPYAFGVNDHTLIPGKHRFVQVVSCNTHNILAMLRLAQAVGGKVLSADYVLMRRMNDISQSGKAIPAPSVDRVRQDKYPGYGSHQAFDAARVMRTMDIEMHDKIHSTALKLDNQLMHLNRFHIKIKNKTTRTKLLEAALDDPLLSISDLRDMNLVFSKGRDHGYAGRIFNQAVLIRDSLEVSPTGTEIFGVCFTPQDGNSLMTSLATVLWFLNPKTYKKRLQPFYKYLDRFHVIYN